ncbi:MAG: glutaminyl-peptide cyclotransferase, partial [Bacteroidota bacterium]|nr:glutaminyl-peptide cyclotransferase [Bacteroidota bacterium]
MVQRKMKMKAMLMLMLIILAVSCGNDKSGGESATDLSISYKLKTRWKHDPHAWTQGLLIHNGQLYESTGQKQSYIGVVDIKTGEADKKVVLDDQYFGEGIAILNDKIYQLTWQNHVGFV